MNISLFVEFGGLIITLFSFGVIFFVERNTSKRSKYLYLFYVAIFSIQGVSFFEKLDISSEGNISLILSSIEFMIFCSGIFLLLPFLYLFIFSKIQQVPKKMVSRYIIIPLVLMLVMTLLVLVGSTYQLYGTETILVLVSVLFICSSIYFGIKIFKIIKEYRNVLINNYSYTEGMEIKWVIKLSYAFFALVGLILLTESLQLYLSQIVFIQLFIAYLSFLILDYVFKSSKSEDLIVLEPENRENGADSENEKNLFEKVNDIVTDKAMYLNPTLNIADVAKEVGVNYKYISKEINAQGFTFLDLINAKRITKAKLMLEDKSNEFLSVEEIGKQVGFKSKATFYKYFKEKYNQTPSMFRKSFK